MSHPERDNFDPRFDPAFQRGFDGEAAGVAPVADIAPAPAAKQEAGAVLAAPGVTDLATPAADVAVQPEGGFQLLDSDLATLIESAAPPIKGNPWVKVLWVITAVFVPTGIWAQAQSQIILNTPYTSSQSYYIIPSVLETLSPTVLLMGLAAGVSATILHATRWRGRK